MRAYTRSTLMFLACLSLWACAPSRTGVVNGMLTTNVRPAIGVTANKPFTLADSGRIYAQPETNVNTAVANATFDYAVYTDPAVSPAERMAYAAIIRLEESDAWAFFPDAGKLPNSFGATRAPDFTGREGDVYTLCIPAEGDWASALVTANGAKSPAQWLAARWVFITDTDTKAIAEYREVWPEGLETPTTDMMLLYDKDAEYLRAFEKRARTVFSFDSSPGDFSSYAPASPRWNLPRMDPNIPALAGEIMSLENSDSNSDSGGGALN